jgi:hypothetical protein
MEINATKIQIVHPTGAGKVCAMEINRMVKHVKSTMIVKAQFAFKIFAEF